MKVRVDRDLCIGMGNCVAFAPTVFQLDEENKALVLDPSSVDDDTLLEAALRMLLSSKMTRVTSCIPELEGGMLA